MNIHHANIIIVYINDGSIVLIMESNTMLMLIKAVRSTEYFSSTY